jgi:hypothetical protein
MAVEQERGSGHEAGIHAGGVLGVSFDQDEALPGGTVAFGFGLQFAQESFFELQDFFYVHAGDEGLGRGRGSVRQDDIFEFVAAGGQDGGAFADFGGIEQVENGKALNGKDFVHAFDAEAALLVEEIGDVGLLESSLLRQVKAGEFAGFDALPEDFTKIILQDFELHGRSIALGYRGEPRGEMLTNKKKRASITKDTKVHEGFFPAWIPSWYFVSLVVDGFRRQAKISTGGFCLSNLD